MDESYSAATGPIVTFPVCSCCRDHNDLLAEADRVICTTCGEPCSCRGCVADAGDTGPERRKETSS